MRASRVFAAILLLWMPACTSYQTLADPVAGLQPSPKPVKKVRVTLQGGEQFELDWPDLAGDSLRGVVRKGSIRSVVLADVTTVEIRVANANKTGFLVVALIVAAGVIWRGVNYYVNLTD